MLVMIDNSKTGADQGFNCDRVMEMIRVACLLLSIDAYTVSEV